MKKYVADNTTYLNILVDQTGSSDDYEAITWTVCDGYIAGILYRDDAIIITSLAKLWKLKNIWMLTGGALFKYCDMRVQFDGADDDDWFNDMPVKY